MKPSGRPIVAAFKRAYSVQAQVARHEQAVLTKQEPNITRLGNGTLLASLENYSPIARVAVVFNAGLRQEPNSQPGLTHCLRNSFSLSNAKTSAFGLTKNIEQLGASLGCATTREQVIYSITCKRDDVELASSLLCETACKPAFLNHEMDHVKHMVQVDFNIYMENLQARLMEALHQAAFRGGLGKSLYCSQHKIGRHTPDMLQEFVSKHYTGGNMALVGTGVSHDLLLFNAREMKMESGSAPALSPSPYHGDEVRIDANSDLCYAAVVTEGLGFTSPDLLKLYVLQKVMGSGSYVKYGSGMASSKVSKAAGQAADGPFAVSCINSTYSDTGLFGFQVVTPVSGAEKVLKAVGAAFGEATKGGITDEDVQRAKYQLKAAILMEMENAGVFFLDFAVQAALSGQVMSVDAIMTEVDKITTADVQNIAKKIVNGKPSMAAIGDLSNTPYLDQIF